MGFIYAPITIYAYQALQADRETGELLSVKRSHKHQKNVVANVVTNVVRLQ